MTTQSLEDADRFTNLIERQRALESQSVADGATLFHRRLASAAKHGTASHVGGSKKLLSEATSRVEAGIRALLEQSAITRGPKHAALAWCEAIGPDVAAFLTVKVVLDVLSHKIVVRDTANTISNLIIDELRFRRFQEKAPGLFTYRMGSFNTSSYVHMARSMTATLTHADVDVSDLTMTPSVKLLVGVKLLNILVETTGLVTLISKRVVKRGRQSKIRQEMYLTPTPETLEWLTNRNNALALLTPIHPPMVVPPLAWEPGRRKGGYRFALRGRHSVARGWDKQQQKMLETVDMPLVYAAVNALQETSWRINTSVLNLVRAIQATGNALGGVPASQPEAMPSTPANIDTDAEVRKAHRKAKHMIHERNHLRMVKALIYAHTIQIAETFEYDEAIFFPFNCDFRGRIYPICSYLNPQGDDLSKGLLTFSEGKALGHDGAYYLAIHGANCLDTTPQGQKLSHLSLDERAVWIEDHTSIILDAATNPLTCTWWASADKPLQFFAFCCEWAAYKKATVELGGNGENFISTLPVSQDGTCNGLQHFSAMFRDATGGAAVNLLPTALPQDIYQRIADMVLSKLERLAASNPLAALWLSSGLITRKLTKRPVMTFGYGSKKYGFQDQTLEYLKQHKDWQKIRETFTDADGKQVLHGACSLLAYLIQDAIAETVVAAGQGMKWLQQCTQEITKENKPVEWRVPGTGFPVRQPYFACTKKQVRTILAGRTVKPEYYEPTNEVLTSKQRNAVAPNVVHSLDAAALMLTVDLARKEGLTHYAFVHDSYGTLAADVGLLADCTRMAFVKLYSNDLDVIGNLHTQWQRQVSDPKHIPAPPPIGSLDIEQVLFSPFFFS